MTIVVKFWILYKRLSGHCRKGSAYIAHVASFLVPTVWADHESPRSILCMIFFAKSLKSWCSFIDDTPLIPVIIRYAVIAHI